MSRLYTALRVEQSAYIESRVSWVQNPPRRASFSSRCNCVVCLCLAISWLTHEVYIHVLNYRQERERRERGGGGGGEGGCVCFHWKQESITG